VEEFLRAAAVLPVAADTTCHLKPATNPALAMYRSSFSRVRTHRDRPAMAW